jgi:hypothetical protein
LISEPVAAGRQYAVAWQNRQAPQGYSLGDISQVIIDTIKQFEI